MDNIDIGDDVEDWGQHEGELPEHILDSNGMVPRWLMKVPCGSGCYDDSVHAYIQHGRDLKGSIPA